MGRAAAKHDTELLRIAAFILFDAMVFHEVLSSKYPTIASLRTARGGTGSLHRVLESEWNKILGIDYGPVFELAKEILGTLPTSPTSDAILKRLADSALDAVGSGILLRHDFMGRIYHRLLLRTTGHFYATYYTSIPAARLLAQLVLKTPNPDWPFRTAEGNWQLDDPRKLEDFRIVDPACGSGTLLSAAYTTLKDIYILSRPSQPDLSQFHRVVVEEVMHGWDILDYAAHLTLTTLALHEHKADFTDSRIAKLDCGVDRAGVHLGSLDLLRPQRTLVGKGFASPAEAKELAGSREIEIPEQFYDIVLMNPPFTRSAKPNVKFGYTTPVARQKMSKELKKIGDALGVKGIGHAGLAAYFIMLGINLLKEGGRLAVVLPRSCLSGVSWRDVRKRLLDKCQIEYIVSNYDSGDADVEPWNWSENTDLGEVLIVAKESKEKKRTPVSYVNLWFKPRNDVESLLVAQQVLRAHESGLPSLVDGGWKPLDIGGTESGAIYSVLQTSLALNLLFPCTFAHPQLNGFVYRLVVDPPFKTTTMTKVAKSIGPDIAQVKQHFQKSKAGAVHSILWGHQGAMNTLALDHGFLGSGVPRKGKRSEQLHKGGAGTILVAERPHLHTEALFATRVSRPVLATAFWEIRPNEDAVAPLILLWLQSTFGFATFLAHATSSMGDIFKMKKAQLAQVTLPDPSTLDLHEAARLLQSLQHEEFLNQPDEFTRAAKGEGPRKKIDDFFIEQLDLDMKMEPYYQLFAGDPVVTTDRFACRI